jgi:hypothetical protein
MFGLIICISSLWRPIFDSGDHVYMKISALYVCPVRGLSRFEPPEPRRLEQAARIAKSLGLEKLYLPVMEVALVGNHRAKIAYLDGIVQALDRVAQAGISACLVAPCYRALGVVWPAPYMVTPIQNPLGDPVFLDGRVRYLRAFDWWREIATVQKRILGLREVVSAGQGHPALSGWVVMDRDFEWARPELQEAEFVLKSFVSEIRERHEKGSVYLGIGWQELFHPEIVQGLSKEVDGLRIGGFEKAAPGLERQGSPATELLQAAYAGALARWLSHKPVEVEIGWGLPEKMQDYDRWFEAWEKFAAQGLEEGIWFNLCDPEPGLCADPPWAMYPGLEGKGLLDQRLNPKDWVEDWINEIKAVKPMDKSSDFLDLSAEEYCSDPQMHFDRLWQHFMEIK